jgi:hypothetical protein
LERDLNTQEKGISNDFIIYISFYVQYPTKKSERRFFCFEPPIHISGNCLALDLNSEGKEQSEWWELGRMKKGVIGSISPWPCLHPTPQKIRAKSDRLSGIVVARKNEQGIIPAAFRFSRHFSKN